LDAEQYVAKPRARCMRFRARASCCWWRPCSFPPSSAPPSLWHIYKDDLRQAVDALNAAVGR